MSAPKKLTIAVASLSLVTIVCFYWHGEKRVDPVAALPISRQQPADASVRATMSVSKVEIQEPERPVPAPPTPELVQTATNKLNSDEFVAEILQHPDHPILPSKIPQLSDSQVNQLTEAYMKIVKPTQKSAILWALGFSQNDRAFDTLRYAMLDEYSGRALSTGDNVAQLQAVRLIGVLSRTSDRAWQFLVNLSHPDNWGRINAWSDDDLTNQYKSEQRSIAQVRSTLQGEVITALSASGRPEFMAWANSLYDGNSDPANFDQHLAASVAHGVFRASFIAEHGFDQFYDAVLYHSGFDYSRWIGSDEGQRWTKWWQDQVTQAITRDRANAQK